MKTAFSFENMMVGGILSCLKRFIAIRFVPLVLIALGMVSSMRAQSDTLICDNGGFENDFQFMFKGQWATMFTGSNTCTPLSSTGNPVVYTNTTLPSYRRFEIVNAGIDPLVGINRTKFGNKALLINNRYGHTSNPTPVCSGARDVNKIIKRFRVTEATRDFTVWYALALENPSGHVNSQPFFSIKCDRAPLTNLCFDADILKCDSIYDDIACPPEKMDVLNWACHRIKIPASELGTIATLEITASDCGCTAHNGYAYIDGLCEECSGSALGSGFLNGSTINYESCGGETARICGTFTKPTICGNYQLQNVTVPGYTISNLVIDNVNKTYCFDFPISNFPQNVNCLEIFANLFFVSGNNTLPAVSTNSIEICKNNYSVSTPTNAMINNVDYLSCNGDVATVCGSYMYDVNCSDYYLDYLIVPGYQVTNLAIDQSSRTFCFDIPKSNFGNQNCLNIVAQLQFIHFYNNTTATLNSPSKQVCKNNYQKQFNVTAVTSACSLNNNTDNLSDDYYSVAVTIPSNATSFPWKIERLLTNNPYSGESGYSLIKEGTGPSSLNLGPFYILEGPWTLTVTIGNCVYTFTITPPVCDYGGCSAFSNVYVSNIVCSSSTPNSWSFVINIQNSVSGTYSLGGGNTYNFNSPYTIQAGTLETTCKEYEIIYSTTTLPIIQCTTKVIVCPPRPCKNNMPCSDLEVKIKKIECNNNRYNINFESETKSGKYLCYKTATSLNGTFSGAASLNNGSTVNGTISGGMTNLTTDIYLLVYLCDSPGCTCDQNGCFKIVYIPKPLDCTTRGTLDGRTRDNDHTIVAKADILMVVPNPFDTDGFELQSTMDKTKFEIYDVSGSLIHRGSFEGQRHYVNLQLKVGMYFVRYIDTNGDYKYIKAIKL